MTDKEKIRAEIERRLEDAKAGVRQNQNRVKLGIDNNQDLVIWQHLESMAVQLISFIDSLQEEPISDELEEASKEWLKPQLNKSYANYGETKMMELTHFDGYAMLDAIEFGAQWQKEHG